MKINEVDPRNFDSDIDYYNALNAKPKARIPSEPRLSPAQQDAEDDDAISQKRQAAHAQFQKGRKVEYVNQEGSAPNGKEYNKLYVIHAKDEVTAQHEEYMFDKHEWGAKKVVDVQKEKNEDGTVTHTLYIVDNHKYGMWKPWKDKPAVESTGELDEKAPPGMEQWIKDRKPEFKKRYGDKWQQVLYATAWKRKNNESVEESADDNPVAGAITRRILLQRADLLQKYGPAKVGQAIDDVADFAGDVEEIGSSDVSAWVKQVEQSLASMGESVAEASPRVDSLVTDALKLMRGPEMSDAIQALKTVLGDREFSSRRGHYNFYVRQLMDMYSQKGVTEDSLEEIDRRGFLKGLGAAAMAGAAGSAKAIDFSDPIDEIVDETIKELSENRALNTSYLPADKKIVLLDGVRKTLYDALISFIQQTGIKNVSTVAKIAKKAGLEKAGEGQFGKFAAAYSAGGHPQVMVKQAYDTCQNFKEAYIGSLRVQFKQFKTNQQPEQPAQQPQKSEQQEIKLNLKPNRKVGDLITVNSGPHEGKRVRVTQVLGPNEKGTGNKGLGVIIEGVTEATDNPADVICVDVPLFIRLMEYAREDASTDMDLHDVAERLTQLSASGDTVTMSSYDEIVGSQKEIKEADMDLEQGRQNILSILKAAEQGGNAEIIVGGEPITLEYPEARFVGGRYKSFMKAGRQEEFLRALTDARAFDRIMTKMRAVLDKQKNFRGSIPGERGVEEDAPAVAKFAGGLGVGLVAAAGAPAIVGILGPLLGIPFAAYSAYSAAKLGMKGVEKLWDMAAEKLGGDDKVEQYTQAKIAKLPPQEAQAAKAVIKQVSESRKSMAPNVDEGVVDAVKAGAKKAFKALTGPDDEELLQRLEKETGGKRPEKKDTKDVDEALLRASARLKENEYFCMMDKQVKLIPEGYKRNSQGYLVRK